MITLIRGDGFEYLETYKPSLVVTDCPFREVERLFRWAEKNDVIVIDAYSTRWLTRECEHTGSKAVAPFVTLIGAFPEEAVVVDPFMGSGSVGIAALECGRDFVGIEINPRWFRLARTRIDAAEYDLKDAEAG